ncbi:hypothetical protein PIB30_065641 [Stylosanthes scabra]|uniref:Uncharacterized protein n=1 Tax=Stylosanthes scabra TaxID=79078 RepID=A0ABU6QLM3_9FABA|nr:hypothetical protein [Stylosanthes scabra]
MAYEIGLDPALEYFEVDLNLFSNDEDALEMVRIAGLMHHVEMFVVHSIQDDEPFPEVGYIDVGPSNAQKKDQSGNGGAEEVGGNECGNAGAGEVLQDYGCRDKVDNVAGGEGQEEGGKTSLDSAEDSDDEEFIPSDLDVESADDIQFTDSEEDYDDDDGGFEELNDNARIDKGKGVANVEFSDGEGYDGEEIERDYEAGGGNDEEDGDSVRFPIYKAQKDMKEY